MWGSNKNKITSMSNKIKHFGIVDGVGTDGIVHVRILQSSACSACKVASHCNASETKEKVVDAANPHSLSIDKGDSVMVVADASIGFRASMYGYLLPLLVMVLTLVVVLACTHSEGMAALSSLGILIPYYFVLYLFREKLKNKLVFYIEHN